MEEGLGNEEAGLLDYSKISSLSPASTHSVENAEKVSIDYLVIIHRDTEDTTNVLVPISAKTLDKEIFLSTTRQALRTKATNYFETPSAVTKDIARLCETDFNFL